MSVIRCFIALLVCCATSAPAVELLSERFERLEKVWRFEGRGEQRVQEGVLRVAGCEAVAGGGDWTDYELSFRARAPQEVEQAQIWASVRRTARDSRYVIGVRGGNNNQVYMARYAPEAWRSPGSVIDCSYAELDAMARGRAGKTVSSAADGVAGLAEPALLTEPPANLGVLAPEVQAAAAAVRGRTVWLVHPWALRAPPADLPADAVVIGVYPREHHHAWPWPAARWRWVDAAMREVCPQRWHIDAAALREALAGAAAVRCTDDPHLPRDMTGIAQREAPPRLFAPVSRHCTSFSQWWTRVTRGVTQAGELL